ncbi:AtpZ/AtpI family protein [Candidatus Peregrinibacteria bacterium]|nr:AtpZ/AtpI family protein [Candidatus Peregrinibacteria bacterium]
MKNADQKERNIKRKVGIDLLQTALEFGVIIGIPLIIFLGIGLLLDKTYHTVPIFIIVGMFVALGISTYALYKKISEILK